MRYYEKDNGMLFKKPQKTATLMKYRMRILECISDDGDIPEAWSGCYADLCLKAAGAMIGAGESDEGFIYLEKAFTLYDTWLQIPEGKKMETGSPTLFDEHLDFSFETLAYLNSPIVRYFLKALNPTINTTFNELGG